jgi:hypothetical protein
MLISQVQADHQQLLDSFKTAEMSLFAGSQLLSDP